MKLRFIICNLHYIKSFRHTPARSNVLWEIISVGYFDLSRQVEVVNARGDEKLYWMVSQAPRAFWQ